MCKNKKLLNLSFVVGITCYVLLGVGFVKHLNGVESSVPNTSENIVISTSYPQTSTTQSINTTEVVSSESSTNTSITTEKETIDIDNVNTLMNELYNTMYSHPNYDISNWKRIVKSTKYEAYRLCFYTESTTQPFNYYVETYTESYFTSELNTIEKLLPTYIKRNSSYISSSVSDTNIFISTHFDSLSLKDGCEVELHLSFGLWYNLDRYSLYFNLTHTYTNCSCEIK